MTYVATDAIDNAVSTSTPSPALTLPPGVTVGQKFGLHSVVCRAANDAGGHIRVQCRCDCGVERIVRLSDLKSGHTKSCHCLRKKAIAWRFGKIQFRRFGTLFVLGKSEEIHETTPTTEWVTFCRLCGKIVLAKTCQLRSGKKRCPCLGDTYNSWRNMIQRCTNVKLFQYQDYGGRGITVCEDWRKSFHRFVEDMDKRPEGKTLDRIDPNGNYTRENCRWADATEQANNRRPLPPRTA